ncbi:multiheme c-type cytochrome [Melioribacter sp. Ez-97]|uniref:multiheme c-type cytochrome n=1 Tax=Melioribacter sp. Ez-97 TaxID=3423434 RepID=UPI003EDB396C
MKKLIVLLLMIAGTITAQPEQGKFSYKDFKKPEFCRSCHNDFYQQWKQAMMSRAYTHEWDEIEYFKLAVPHAEKDEKVAEVKAGCNGCHSPIAYVTGDTPPPLPKENSRANESVSCDVCHSIKGYSGDVPYNFNYIIDPGKTKFTSRKNSVDSPVHEIVVTELHKSGDFCGICHNEKSPYGVWVKSTHLEWKEGPYAKEGVQCQDCHMTKGEMKTASMGPAYKDAKLHLFHGAHDPGKVRGVIELRINPDMREAEPGETVKFTLALFNQKTGHKFPTGSVEDRIVWLHVEAVDANGKVYHLPVDKKGFEGEEYTIASKELAYQDMGIALGNPDFKGVERDGVPEGDRIFRMPYFDPQGRMTIQQWNTASLGVDYRIGPRETKLETFTFHIPDDMPPGKLKVTAVLNYQLLVKPVADFLGVPEEESRIVEVNRHSTEIEILP